jgi:transcription elongation factor GreA
LGKATIWPRLRLEPPKECGRSVFLGIGVKMMATRKTYLTMEGRENLQKELNDLTTVRRKEVAFRIHKASETGGTVDNAEYEEAKNEQAFVEGRISDLENILSNAVVAAKDGRTGGAVEFGSSVTVVTDEGKSKRYKVVGSAEADPLEGKISVESPVGRSLLGHKVGDSVDVVTPSGVVNLTIKRIK